MNFSQANSTGTYNMKDAFNFNIDFVVIDVKCVLLIFLTHPSSLARYGDS